MSTIKRTLILALLATTMAFGTFGAPALQTAAAQAATLQASGIITKVLVSGDGKVVMVCRYLNGVLLYCDIYHS